LREFLKPGGEPHVSRLLSGHYLLEPWLRVRVDADGEWIVAYGIEVSRDGKDGA